MGKVYFVEKGGLRLGWMRKWIEDEGAGEQAIFRGRISRQSQWHGDTKAMKQEEKWQIIKRCAEKTVQLQW